jgi:hypothetical protein
MAQSSLAWQHRRPPVETIDYQKRTVTLKGLEGNLATSRVAKSVKRFVVAAFIRSIIPYMENLNSQFQPVRT